MRRFFDGAGAAAIGAILGSAIPLSLAGFTGSDAERDMYEAIAGLYERLAQESAKDEIDALTAFFPKAKTN